MILICCITSFLILVPVVVVHACAFAKRLPSCPTKFSFNSNIFQNSCLSRIFRPPFFSRFHTVTGLFCCSLIIRWHVHLAPFSISLYPWSSVNEFHVVLSYSYKVLNLHRFKAPLNYPTRAIQCQVFFFLFVYIFIHPVRVHSYSPSQKL